MTEKGGMYCPCCGKLNATANPPRRLVSNCDGCDEVILWVGPLWGAKTTDRMTVKLH